MGSEIGVRAANGVAHLTLNRPEAMNAITTELARALEQELAAAAEDAGAIVIRGAGGNFCAGGDYKHLEGLRERPHPPAGAAGRRPAVGGGAFGWRAEEQAQHRGDSSRGPTGTSRSGRYSQVSATSSQAA